MNLGNMAPLITIGITCFNAADTIERAVMSARAQSWGNTEIIVIDDGSIDGSWDKLQTLPAIRIFKNKAHKGVAASCNKIIQEAAGDFIAFFGAEDVSTPTRLERQYRRLKDYEHNYTDDDELILCYTARQQIYPDGVKGRKTTVGTSITSGAPYGPDMARHVLIGKPLYNGFGSLAICTQMARREVFLALDGFDENLRGCEDTDLSIRAALAGGHFVGIDEALVTQFMTDGRAKNVMDERDCILKIADKYKDFLDQNGGYRANRDWVDIKYDLSEGNIIHFLYRCSGLFLRHPLFTIKRICWAVQAL